MNTHYPLKGIPCIDCVCLPVCRHKDYMSLFSQCSLLNNYIPKHNAVDRTSIYFYALQDILKPTKWKHEYKPHINDMHPLIYDPKSIMGPKTEE